MRGCEPRGGASRPPRPVRGRAAPVRAIPRLDRGVPVGVDGTTGPQLFRTRTPDPASLRVTFASDGVVVAERLGCFNADRPNPERSTVMVRYDVDLVASAGTSVRGSSASVSMPAAGVAHTRSASVRDVATEERMSLDPETWGGPLVSRRRVGSHSRCDPRTSGHQRRRTRGRPSERCGPGHRNDPLVVPTRRSTPLRTLAADEGWRFTSCPQRPESSSA
jgi:hypothetical protein